MSDDNDDGLRAYYEYAAAQENGDSDRFQAMDRVMTYSSNRGMSQAYPAQRRSNAKEKYWRGNAPVMEKVDHNGETVMLPVVAPSSEKVNIKKPILDQTVNIIRDQQTTKATWNWKVGILDERFRLQVPSSKALTMNALRALKTRTTANVYVFRDVRLHGNMVNADLPIEDPAAVGTILPASAAAARWMK